MDQLTAALHYTYTFFPDDKAKNDIPYYVFQKPVYNWKLACENDPQKNLANTIKLIEESEYKGDTKPWVELDKGFNGGPNWFMFCAAMTILAPLFPIFTGYYIIYLYLSPTKEAYRTLSYY